MLYPEQYMFYKSILQKSITCIYIVYEHAETITSTWFVSNHIYMKKYKNQMFKQSYCHKVGSI